MQIAVIGRGNVGGGLADLWEEAGHDVTRIGREGGDVFDAEAVLVAVPGGAIAEAFYSVEGLGDRATRYRHEHSLGVEDVTAFSSDPRHIVARLLPEVRKPTTDIASAYNRDLHLTLPRFTH